jgi:uncharacterized protein (DUF58 family)
MTAATSPEALREVHARMKRVVQAVRLPFRRHNWRGPAGNWLGVGIGSSIDFQDHRPYLPGDDPRYIDWQAYARSGSYTMKLYREEVSPRVDLVLDASASMGLTAEKQLRFQELVYFALESALQTSASIRVYRAGGGGWEQVELSVLLAHAWPDAAGAAGFPALALIPFRHASMRIWVTDLLFPGSPEPAMGALRAGGGRAVILAVYAAEEADPPWTGNVLLRDCETGGQRRQHMREDVRRGYRDAYRRHFGMWADQARRRDVPLARVVAEGDFLAALRRDALRVEAVEVLA